MIGYSNVPHAAIPGFAEPSTTFTGEIQQVNGLHAVEEIELPVGGDSLRGSLSWRLV